jgi:hypothetical protein
MCVYNRGILTSIEGNEEVPIIGNFQLFQNYPNPFNPTTTIPYQITKTSFAKLSIYDINGRLVKKLVSEQQNTGFYKVEWNADKVVSGIYFYRIEAGEYSRVKKCLVVK